MKILELRFKNLNSLYGEWNIDFSTPEFISNGIFAITGPTGAGKSTILDAICLALYGATPRLGKITKSSNQLMSQQTAECYAEVTFESQQGKFTCHWSQHKARKKIDGTLGESKHEIIDTLTGQILESKKRDVANVIEEKTGMDFERFTRSILLAQGGFAAFLMATADERAPILEQITGTEIYSEISKRVHEKAREEKDKLNLIQMELAGIKLLNEDEEESYNLEIIDKRKQEAELVIRAQNLTSAINWLTSIDKLNEDITILTREYEGLNKELVLFEADRNKLSKANKAMELDGRYATLKELRKQQINDKEVLSREEIKLPAIQATLVSQNEQYIRTEQNLTDIKNEQKIKAGIIKNVRTLDQQLIDKKREMDTTKKDYEKISGEVTLKTNQLAKIQQSIGLLNEKQKLVNTYLESHGEDAGLLTELTGIEEQLKALISKQADISGIMEALKALDEKLKDDQVNLEKYVHHEKEHQSKLTDNQNQVKLIQQELNQLLGEQILREYRVQKENLLREMGFLRKIASLEAERQKLEDGKPCPLCGSEDHPYAENNVPQIDETEAKINSLTTLIDQAEKFEHKIKELKTSEEEFRQNVLDSEKLKSNALNEKKQTEKEHTEFSKQIIKFTSDFNTLKQTAFKRLEKFGIKEIPTSNLEQLLNSLKERLKKWEDKEKERLNFDKQYNELNNNVRTLEAVIATLKETLTEKQNDLQKINIEYTGINEERIKLFGINSPEEEETKLENKLHEAEKDKNLIQDQLNKMTRECDATKAKIQTLSEQISSRDPLLLESETNFISALKKLDFSDEINYLSNSISADDRSILTERAKLLDTNKTSLDAKITDRKERLATEKDKHITESSLNELKPTLDECNGNLKLIQDRIATLFVELKMHNENKEKFESKQELCEKQKIECGRMEKLHGLIGSSDGKKFRNFAQGLTFELMVNHANRQLEKMTDRYLLIRDKDQSLDLNVLDNYQAGEIRTTKNLSGGESFIVSLSLALGLSKMASQKVRVDSLFLDEGFGTLDDDALETALETLGELQQDGKMIGIISHVQALKERISTQINVQPVSGGRSAITGPGCKKILRDDNSQKSELISKMPD
ncbi:MAG: AAA family ATPase [Legionella sp.]|jgi:exonuclease SbcC